MQVEYAAVVDGRVILLRGRRSPVADEGALEGLAAVVAQIWEVLDGEEGLIEVVGCVGQGLLMHSYE
jgi:hypothetical protein